VRALRFAPSRIPSIVIRLLLRARYISFAAVVALLAVLIALGRHVTYEQSIQSFFAEDDPAVKSYREATAAFGNDQFVFVVYDDPELLSPAGMDRVAELARAVGPDRIPGVVRVETLDAMPVLWQIDDRLLELAELDARLDRLALSPLLAPAARVARAARDSVLEAVKKGLKDFNASDSPLTIGGAIRAAGPGDLAGLRKRITVHPLLRGTLVDASGTTSAIVVRLKAPQEHDAKVTVAALREQADGFARRHGLGRPAVVGPPVLLADGFASIEIDGRRLALVGMLLIGLVTLTATRSIWWALVPLVAGWTVWTATETVLWGLGLKLSLSGGPLVAQIIVLTMPAVSHLALHFRDDRRKQGDAREAAGATLRAVAAPILWCALTGTIGYGALMTSKVEPIRQFGAVLAVCTAVAAILTLAISPVAMLPPLRLEIPVLLGSTSRTSAAMNRLSAWVVRHPGGIVFGTFAVILPMTAGMWFLRYESNYVNAFKPDSRIVGDYRAVEAKLGGIGLVYLVVPVRGTIDVATLEKFRGLDAALAALRNPDGAPASAQVLSLATVLDPDGRLAGLDAEPRARALATKLDLIAASPQAGLLRGFWNPEDGLARVMVRLREQQPAATKEATFDRATALAASAFGSEVSLTGLSHLLTRTTRGIIATQWSTFFWSAGGILLMLSIAFRGPRLAVLAILPTLLAVGLVLGLMGWLGVRLDLATALVASVALGLSVDDTFHCLLQFRRHRATASFRESLVSSYAVTGPGVLLSSLAVAIGFAVLRFSQFVPFSNFGTMVGIATAGSSLGNLVLLPACLTLGERWRVGKDVPLEIRAPSAPLQ
jgi:predicted RND superfamily exporter protein